MNFSLANQTRSLIFSSSIYYYYEVHINILLAVDGGDGLHVAAAPVPAEVLGLHLQQLQDVQLHHRVPDLEGALQDGRRAEDHQHHCAEVLPLGQLLQDPHQVDAGEEVSPAVARVRGGALYDVAGGVHVLCVCGYRREEMVHITSVFNFFSKE